MDVFREGSGREAEGEMGRRRGSWELSFAPVTLVTTLTPTLGKWPGHVSAQSYGHWEINDELGAEEEEAEEEDSRGKVTEKVAVKGNGEVRGTANVVQVMLAVYCLRYHLALLVPQDALK